MFAHIYPFFFSFACRRPVPRRARKLNPLRHMRTMIRLNPYAAVLKRRASRAAARRTLAKEAIILKKEGVSMRKVGRGR